MSSTLTEPDRLFDRLWQPGHSFRPRCGPGRRWGVLALLVVLSILIGAYWIATDPVRVRRLAESYLSELSGGRVKVGGASLSIFEGLRLSRVSVMVQGAEAADSTLFVVDSLDIQYDPASLLRGRLDATRLVATGPHVYLVENLGDGTWNYQRLHRSTLRPRGVRSPTASDQPLILPEIVLRNARVEYSELRDGRYSSRGVMGLEGRLSPSLEHNQYLFELQSRGAIQSVGPVLVGDVRLNTGQVTASLSNLNFGPDILAMLPSEVRQLWQAHHLLGRLNIPVFNYTPEAHGKKSAFFLRTEFQNVRLVVRPQELAGAGAARRLDALETSIGNLRSAGFTFAPLADSLATAVIPPDMAVENVTGTFRFDPAGVAFDGVGGSFEGIPIVMSGTAAGYAPDVPFHLHAQSPPDRVVQLQPQLKYLSSLPGIARQVYRMVRPVGYCTFAGDVDRPAAGAKPRVTGNLQVLDCGFTFQFFPYPMRHVTGQLALSADAQTGDQRLELQHLRGIGQPGGPNSDTRVAIDGWLGPFDKRLGCDVRIASDRVVSDPRLIAAFPPEVREALSAFRTLPKEGAGAPKPYPDFSGGFVCRVEMPIAVGSRVSLSTDIHLEDAAGELVAFPYPFRHAQGDLHVRDGRLDIDHVGTNSGNASVLLNGHITWPTPLHPGVPAASTVQVQARSVPIDQTLLTALPADKASVLHHAGATGSLDVDGTVFTEPLSASSRAGSTSLSQARASFALDLGLKDVALKTAEGRPKFDHLNGIIHLSPTGAKTETLHARRGPAELAGSGAVDWSAGPTVMHASATAHGLVLDDELRKLLPPLGESAWAAVDPHGSVNAELSIARNGPVLEKYELTLHPDHASIRPAFLPYALTDCTGAINVTPQRTTITALSGAHGGARVTVSGVGLNGSPVAWDLSMHAADMPVDDELRKALPAVVTGMIDQVNLRGRVSVDLSKLNFRAQAGHSIDTCDADIAGVVHGDSATLDLGIPVENVNGDVTFDSAVRGGKLASLRGKLAVTSLDLAGRSVQDLSADLIKPLGESALQVDHIQGRLSGGEFAGQASLRFPESSPTRYSLNFVLRNADVRDIARGGADVQGQLSASVALEGLVNDAGSRRGRGDVQVIGQRMYQIPLLLGLLQVTDLALPSNSPFNEATARYNVDGQRISFDQIQMRSNTMLMNGNGWMDFGSKKVRMNFTTDNANLPQLPFLHELWQGAKQELLQIQVRGTIQSPKVNAASFHTFTTTVDEVFSGSGTEK